jgi:hypothetical protein
MPLLTDTPITPGVVRRLIERFETVFDPHRPGYAPAGELALLKMDLELAVRRHGHDYDAIAATVRAGREDWGRRWGQEPLPPPRHTTGRRAGTARVRPRTEADVARSPAVGRRTRAARPLVHV